MRKVLLLLLLAIFLSSCLLGIFNRTPKGMVLVEGGQFTMGNWFGNDTFQVQLSSYYMGKKEVSITEILEWLNDDNLSPPGYKDGVLMLSLQTDALCGIQYSDSMYSFRANEAPINENSSVVGITWYGACTYCNWRSKQEGRDTVYVIDGADYSSDFLKNGYRLPTEAEWEFAARARGSKDNAYSGTNSTDSLDLYAWYDDNAFNVSPANFNYGVHPSGQKRPNALGIYDMTGNVFEWCWDWHALYVHDAVVNPKGPETGSSKILRGGAWRFDEYYTKVFHRDYVAPSFLDRAIGFRLAMSVPEK